MPIYKSVCTKMYKNIFRVYANMHKKFIKEYINILKNIKNENSSIMREIAINFAIFYCKYLLFKYKKEIE